MVDVFTSEQRSYVMSCVRSSGNLSTEVALAALLRSAGVSGWRRQAAIVIRNGGGSARGSRSRSLKVVPDFVFRSRRVAVFVDGCFWHGCRLHGTAPKTNEEWWRDKLVSNQARDRRVNRLLRRKHWRVIRLWEHDLKVRPAHCVWRVRRAIEAAR